MTRDYRLFIKDILEAIEGGPMTVTGPPRFEAKIQKRLLAWG